MTTTPAPTSHTPNEPYPFQIEASNHLALSTTQLLAHEMGLGKTRTTIMAADRVGALSILVICNAVGKTHWKTEFGRWQTVFRSAGAIHGLSQPAPHTDVVICNYDIISRAGSPAAQSLFDREWDLLILDEGHALKSTSSKRTKTVYGKGCLGKGGLSERALRVWVLSGTPAPNNASELYPHLRALAPNLIRGARNAPMTENQFIEAFCQFRDTTFGRQITGSKNIDHLRKRIDPFIMRKRKKDVLHDLPPLAFDTLLVSPHDINLPIDLLKDLVDADRAVMANLAFTTAILEDADTDIDTATAMLGTLRTDTHLATQRRAAGRIKAEAAIELVEQELAGNASKIILFAWHHQVIDRLVQGLSHLGVVRIDGRDDDKAKDFAVKAFQANPHVRVFVGQIQAAGTSITLTASSNVLFVEADWVPGNNLQAACRAHRIGQKDGVLARFISLEGSVDRHLMAVVARKTRELGQLIDNEKPIGGATEAGTFPEIVET